MNSEPDRRPLLKILGAGAAFSLLPKSWTRPVVHSLVVPAHAAASPPPATTTAAPTTTPGGTAL